MKKIIALILIILAISAGHSTVSACTIFNVTKDNATVVGNNEDTVTMAGNKEVFDKGAKVWFLPEEQGKFGRVFFGFRDAYPFGGMNEKGLFFDFVASADRGKAPGSPGKINYEGCLSEKILEECATVDQALDMYKKYNDQIFGYADAGVMYVDKQGASAVVSWDRERNELSIVKKSGGFQVLGYGYKIINTELTGNNGDISVERFRKLLDYSHQGDMTIYSNIYDLNNKEIYVYYLHNYDYSIKFNLEDELKKGKHFYNLYDLFPVKKSVAPVKEYSFKEFSRGETGLIIVITLAFAAPLIVCPVFYLAGYFKKKRNRITYGKALHISWIVTALNSMLGLLILYLILRYMPLIGKYGFEITGKIFAHLPLHMVLLTAVLILIMSFAWKRKSMNVAFRVFLSITDIEAIFFIILLKTLNVPLV